MRSEDSILEEITVSVPRLRDVSGREAMVKLAAFLQAIDIDCTLDASGRQITYGPEAEGAELEFILSMIKVFDARIRSVPTLEERKEAEELMSALKNETRRNLPQ